MFANMASLNKWRRARGFSNIKLLFTRVSCIDLNLQTPSYFVHTPEKLATQIILRPPS